MKEIEEQNKVIGLEMREMREENKAREQAREQEMREIKEENKAIE